MRFLLLIVIFPFYLFAQPKGWQEITISDGLSQGMIFDLKQDRKGFIWAATKDGLNRYDGHNFTTFTHDPYNDFSLSGNSCLSLLIDRHQRLWVGTLNRGLNLFDDRTQRFYHINISDQASDNAGNYEVRMLTEDPEGNIWVGTGRNKLFKISLPQSLQNRFPETADFTRQVQISTVFLDQQKISNSAFCLSFRPNGTAFFGSDNGVYSFNWRKPAKSVQLNLFAVEKPDFYSMYEHPRQGFWFAVGSDKIRGWHRGAQKTITLPRRKYVGVVVKAVDQNTVAVAATDYLWLMSPAELFAQDSLTAKNAFATFPPNDFAVINLLKDRTGNIWVGTNGYGLRKFNPKVRQFHAYLATTSLSHLYVDRQGVTYVRSQFSYGKLDRNQNRLLPFLNPNLPEADRRQRHFVQDRHGFFWVSNTHFQTRQHQLFKFSPDWQLLKKYPLPAGTAFGFADNQTLEDSVGNLWIGATNGKLLRFNPLAETFQVFSYQSLLPQSGTDVETFALHQDQAGTFWIGTQQGLIKAEHPLTTPVFSIYKNAKTDRQSLSNDFVSSLLDDPREPKRYLWVGTKGGGLDRFDKHTGRFEHFTEAQGLPNKVVYGILADEFKNLWLSTNRGLAQFNPQTRQFRNYTKADGLQDDEFNTGSFFKTAAGELLFGGINGLTVFRAAEVGRANPNQPLVNIIGLKVNNETVGVGSADGILAQSIEHTQRLDLSHVQNLLTLEFGVMDYTNSAKNRYRYRLEGIDRDWVEAGTNRFANYAQLPDGNYRFAMMGSADGEVWSQPVELQIRVHPPFYRTWWAYLVYFLLFVVVGWLLYRFQTQRLLLQQQVLFEHKEASRLAELDVLKTQFFTNVSHEFRTPLTLILGPLADLKSRFPAEQALALMERNGNRLMSLINQLLDLSKLEVGQLKTEPEPGDLAAFFRILAGSFQSLAESRGIRFSFEQNLPAYWAEFDRDKLEKIGSNLLSNAIKFTPNGNDVWMSVFFDETGRTVRLQVKDSGIGIAPENLANIFDRFYQVDGKHNRTYEGTGIGLALVKELVQVLHGTIDTTSTEGVGTTFAVTLPLYPIEKPVSFEETSENQSILEPVTGSKNYFSPLNEANSAGENRSIKPPVSETSLLIIDDNEEIRAYVRSIFETEYQIVEAVDGQDGLERATAELPDLVICDLMMPRLDGFGFCRALKTQEATSHIPVVMLTAKAGVENRIDGFELGADDYLTKPFNRAEIRARVRNLIQQRERLNHWFAASQSLKNIPIAMPVPLTAEQRFIDRLTVIVTNHLSDADFSVEVLAETANLSRVQLHRKLKALTNQSATHFIRQLRLAKAADLLTEGEFVTQVAYAVGFDNLSYFAKVFQEQYGVLPSQFGKPETPVS